MPDWKEAIRDRLEAAKLDPLSEAEIVEELAQHLNDRYRELQAGGIPDQECRHRVLAELDGSGHLIREANRFRRPPARAPAPGILALEGRHIFGLTHDLKIAVRNIRTRPWFSLIVIGMLALGVAGNAAMFSIFDGLFLRPLPFPDPDRLVDLDETAPKWNLKYVGVSAPDLYQWRESNSTFTAMAFFRDASYNLSTGGTAERIEAAQVTRDMLDVLGMQPAIGRNFTLEEDKPGGPSVVLLSDGLWQRMFQGDPGVLGRSLKLDEHIYTVVGVLPREALFLDRAELLTPLAADPNTNTGYYVNGVGRLKPGTSLEQARSDLLRVHKAMIPEHKVNEITSPILTVLRDRYLGDFQTATHVLLAAVAVVLLIACVNIAALVMVRSSFRSREMAIRAALGASRIRIVAQLLVENAVLAGIGGAVGVGLGALGLRAMVSAMPDEMPRWITFSLDWRFALFCIAITGAAALLFGLAPALQNSRVDIRGSLQALAARTTASPGQRLALGALIACQIGLALVLSISATFLTEALWNVLHSDPGFRPENVITFKLSIPDATYDSPELRVAYYNNLLARLRSMPDVVAAGATSGPPLGGHWGGAFEAEGGRGPGPQGENPVVLQVAATPGYFEAIGMTLRDGRAFEEQDGKPNSPTAVMVNETFAKYFWGEGSPVGKRIRRLGRNDWYQVIGLLRDEKHEGPDQDAKPGVFLPYRAVAFAADRGDSRSLREITVILRTRIDPAMLVGAAREIIRQLDPDVPMYGVNTMVEQMNRVLWVRRAYSWLCGAFAMIATLLAAAGVYGMVSYAVSNRTQEIGIRIALGARPAQVLSHVLLRWMVPVSIGVGAGLAGAFWATRLFQSLLFGVSPRDPLIYGAVVLVMFGVGLLANYVPARRAARVDPIRALHFE